MWLSPELCYEYVRGFQIIPDYEWLKFIYKLYKQVRSVINNLSELVFSDDSRLLLTDINYLDNISICPATQTKV